MATTHARTTECKYDNVYSWLYVCMYVYCVHTCVNICVLNITRMYLYNMIGLLFESRLRTICVYRYDMSGTRRVLGYTRIWIYIIYYVVYVDDVGVSIWIFGMIYDGVYVYALCFYCEYNVFVGLLFVDTTDVWLYDLMATTHARSTESKYDNVYSWLYVCMYIVCTHV